MARQTSSSTTPDKPAKVKKTRWYHSVWQAYTFTRQIDPAVTWWILGAFFGVIGIGLGIGLLVDSPVYLVIIALPMAFLAALALLANRTQRASYRQLEGRPGAALSALRSIRRGWDFPEEPVAMDPRTQDMVFRGVGRPGVVLVSEGPAHRVGKLIEQERKRVSRVLPKVPVIVIQCGNDEGQVPLRKLAQRVQRLKPALDKQAVAEITKRLKAIGGARLPVPKGIDPFKARPDRKGVRGR